MIQVTRDIIIDIDNEIGEVDLSTANQEAAANAPRPALGPARVTKLRKADALHHTLQRRILLGDLTPETQLTEQRIAAEFGLSQGTVREALMRLQQDGLVSRRGYRGTAVSTTSTTEAVHLVNIRLEVETAGVALVAGRLPAASRRSLLMIVDAMAEAVANRDAYACSELDRDFHATLFRASGLDTMEPILRRCALHMHRFTVNERPEFFTYDDIAEAHLCLLETIEAGDKDAACAVIRQHVHGVIAHWSPDLADALHDQQRR